MEDILTAEEPDLKRDFDQTVGLNYVFFISSIFPQHNIILNIDK